MCGSVLIDLKKAFDLVDHGCLLHKLEHYGVRGSSLAWFRDYLTTRSQKVQFKNDLSPGLRLDFGVPQGSILGPLLFILYINDLPECLVNCSIGMYADDTVIYFSDFSPVEIKRAVQDDLDRIAQWMDTNRLILNQSKTKGMLFGTRQKLDNAVFNIMLSGNKME